MITDTYEKSIVETIVNEFIENNFQVINTSIDLLGNIELLAPSLEDMFDCELCENFDNTRASDKCKRCASEFKVNTNKFLVESGNTIYIPNDKIRKIIEDELFYIYKIGFYVYKTKSNILFIKTKDKYESFKTLLLIIKKDLDLLKRIRENSNRW